MEFDFESELKRLFVAVKELRETQRRYFSCRNSVNLQKAMTAEKQIDAELKRLDGFLGEQRTIF